MNTSAEPMSRQTTSKILHAGNKYYRVLVPVDEDLTRRLQRKEIEVGLREKQNRKGDHVREEKN